MRCAAILALIGVLCSCQQAVAAKRPKAKRQDLKINRMYPPVTRQTFVEWLATEYQPKGGR